MGWARAWDLYAGLASGGCARACVGSYVEVRGLGWGRRRERWAEVMGRASGGPPRARQNKTGRAGKPRLGDSVTFRLADRYLLSNKEMQVSWLTGPAPMRDYGKSASDGLPGETVFGGCGASWMSLDKLHLSRQTVRVPFSVSRHLVVRQVYSAKVYSEPARPASPGFNEPWQYCAMQFIHPSQIELQACADYCTIFWKGGGGGHKAERTK